MEVGKGKKEEGFSDLFGEAERASADRVKIRMKPQGEGRMKAVLSHCCLRLEAWVLFTIGRYDRAANAESNTLGDRTNSLSDSTTASETFCGASICHGRVPQLTHKRSNKAGAETPGFSPSLQKFSLCLVADSTNSSIFGILEISTQLS
jgi:hypothetical protein